MHSDNVPHMAYDIGGQRWLKDAPGFAEAIADAFEQGKRPRCLCVRGEDGQGIEMYVARLMDGYIVKRMPKTGSQHATICPSYEPSADMSGLGPLLGSAIVENPTTGATVLKLDFPMTKLPGRSALPPAGSATSSVSSQGCKLGLRALLHYLWDVAELTHWRPGFSGRRTWSIVRRHLLRASESKYVHGCPLSFDLFVPEVFSVEQSAAITDRRMQLWAKAVAAPFQVQRLLLMIAEVKKIVPARYGYKLFVKHVPDRPFALDEPQLRRMHRCFEPELTLWRADDDLHLLAIATFGVTESGVPSIKELSLMTTSRQWLPIEESCELQLIDGLVRDGRAFIKLLRFDAKPETGQASVMLMDCGTSPQPIFLKEHKARLV